MSRLPAVVFAFCCFTAAVAAAEGPASDTGVLNNEVRLGAGATEAQVIVYGTAADPKAPPKITELMNVAGQPQVAWRLVREVARTTSGTPPSTRIEWLFAVKVDALNADTSMARVAQFASGNATRLIHYTLTNRPKALTWSITAPQASVVVPANKEVTLFATMTAGESQPPVPLHIARIALQDDSGRAVDAAALSIVGADGKPASLSSSGIRPLVLKIDSAKLRNGKFTGNVDLAAAGSVETKSFPLTINRSSGPAQFAGAFLILIGVVLSVLVGVIAKNVVARAEALAPATRLREIADALEKRLVGCVGAQDAPSLLSALRRVRDDVSSKKLRTLGYLQSIFGSPFSSAAAASSDYAVYLQARSDALEAYAALIERGFCEVARVKRQHPPATAAQQQAYGTALSSLDALAAAPPPYDLTVLRQSVVAILATLVAAAGVPPLGGAAPQGRSVTTQQLFYVVDAVNLGAWVIWALVTTATGAAVLILSNPAFGTPIDFIKAFLWGLGVQIAGQQLQQLLPSHVSTALGIKFPSV